MTLASLVLKASLWNLKHLLSGLIFGILDSNGFIFCSLSLSSLDFSAELSSSVSFVWLVSAYKNSNLSNFLLHDWCWWEQKSNGCQSGVNSSEELEALPRVHRPRALWFLCFYCLLEKIHHWVVKSCFIAQSTKSLSIVSIKFKCKNYEQSDC